MSPGEGYDQGSTNQASANKGAVEWLIRGAVAAAAISPGVISILDLGSATGKNSAGELKHAVDAILQAEQLL
ncbi:hypothetical protein WJX74_000708 [Apatococcus lobatus]|uniref:Uncharacterized protein n=1 Tax=Apatococcus lobatus TaxID=904363 RepID=A0AAW1QHG7_9CHLO